MTRLGKCSGLASLILACALLPAGGATAGQAKQIHFEKGLLVRIDGELTAADSVARGRLFKLYAVKLQKDKTYQIDLHNVDQRGFDPYLILQDATGKTVAEDDSSGGGLNARLLHTPKETAVYHIVVTTTPLGQSGCFTLTVGEKGAKAAETRPLELNGGRGVVVAHLLADDPREQGKPTQVFACQFAKDRTYRICMESDDFDTYLYLLGPDGNRLAQDDDSYGDLNAEIIYHASSAGTYRIVATSYSSKATGSFTMTVVEVESVKLEAGMAVLKGRLGVNDPRFLGKRARVYPVLLEAGKTYHFDLASKDSGACLYLLGPTGEILARDDTGKNMTARIMFEVKNTGLYHLNAASLHPPLAGDYTLSISSATNKRE
jgi:hypothetical protein